MLNELNNKNRVSKAEFLIDLSENKKRFFIKHQFLAPANFVLLKDDYFKKWGKFDPQTKSWNFDLADHYQMVEEARIQFSHIIDLKPLIMAEFSLEFLLYAENKFTVKSSSNFARGFTIEDFKELVKENKIPFQSIGDLLIFDLNQQQNLTNKVIFKFPNIQFTPIPQGVMQLFADSQKKSPNNVDMDRIEKVISPSIFNQLKDFQKESVLRAIQHNGRLLLGDDMGLGKTLQSLSVADYYSDKWPLLIITTKTGVITWKQEINHWMSDSLRERFGLDIKTPIDTLIQVIDNSADLENISESAKIIILKYGLLKTENSIRLSNLPTKFVIVDESHSIKDKRADRTNVLIELTKQTAHVLLLSGTPAVMCPSELYPQLKVINAALFESDIEFERRYCDPKLIQHNYEGDMHYETSGYSNLDELKLILAKLMIRRDKLDLSHYFPAKNRSIIRISTHFSDAKLKSKFDYAKSKYFYYRRMARKFQNITKNEKKRIFGKIEKHLNSFLGSTCDAKIFPVCSHIQKIARNLQSKLIIVCRHKNMLDAIEQMCKNNNYDCIKIHGETQSDSREEQINRFKQDEETKIAILSYGTLASLTLNESSHIIFAELNWTPASILQAEDRICRIGQLNPVQIDYLVAYDSADPYVYRRVEYRLEILNKMGLSKDKLPDLKDFKYDQFEIGDDDENDVLSVSVDEEPSHDRLTDFDEDDYVYDFDKTVEEAEEAEEAEETEEIEGEEGEESEEDSEEDDGGPDTQSEDGDFECSKTDKEIKNGNLSSRAPSTRNKARKNYEESEASTDSYDSDDSSDFSDFLEEQTNQSVEEIFEDNKDTEVAYRPKRKSIKIESDEEDENEFPIHRKKKPLIIDSDESSLL